MSLSRVVSMPVDLATSLEFPIAGINPNGVSEYLERVTIIPGATTAKAAVNFTNLELIDKESDGTGTGSIAKVTTEDIATGQALTANVPFDLPLNGGVPGADAEPYLVTYGLTLKKTDAAAAVDIQESMVVLEFRQIG